MIDALRMLCTEVASPTAPTEVAQSVGRVVADEGGLTAIHVQPSSPFFPEARVVRRPDGLLSHVELDLARPVPLAEFVAAFGEPSSLPGMRGRPARVVFRSGQCVLIASVDDDRQVMAISVRSDAA